MNTLELADVILDLFSRRSSPNVDEIMRESRSRKGRNSKTRAHNSTVAPPRSALGTGADVPGVRRGGPRQ